MKVPSEIVTVVKSGNSWLYPRLTTVHRHKKQKADATLATLAVHHCTWHFFVMVIEELRNEFRSVGERFALVGASERIHLGNAVAVGAR